MAVNCGQKIYKYIEIPISFNVTDMLADDPFEIFLVMLSEKKLKVKARVSFDCKGIAEFK